MIDSISVCVLAPASINEGDGPVQVCAMNPFQCLPITTAFGMTGTRPDS